MNKKYRITNYDDQLALGLASMMFSVGLFYLYSEKFKSNNFCLMNTNDPFCKFKSNQTNCFTQNDTSVLAENFGFGGFIEIESGFGFVI